MPNRNIEEMEREVAKRPKTDFQHQPDQSQHGLEVERARQHEQHQDQDDRNDQSQSQSQSQS